MHFISAVMHKKEYKKCKLKCFELLYTLVNNFPKKIEKHFSYTLTTCMPVLFSSYVSSDEKDKFLTLVTLILEKGEHSIDLETAVNVYRNLFHCISQTFNKTPTGMIRVCIS